MRFRNALVLFFEPPVVFFGILVLLFELRRVPCVEFLACFHGDEAAHGVVIAAATLRAGDLETALTVAGAFAEFSGGHRWREFHGHAHTGNCVLFHAKLGQEKAMYHVLAAEIDPDRPADRQMELVERSNVVLAGGVVSVETDTV